MKNVSVDEQQPATISNLRYVASTWELSLQGNPICKNIKENINRLIQLCFSGSQVSQTQFDSCEQLKSAFAAYEENQLQKLQEDNVLGNIN